MGQQQLLFLILGVCIMGIAMSTGIIILQSQDSLNHRQAIYSDMQRLAAEAQAYRNRSFETGGGDGTFLGLTSTPQGIEKLTRTPLTAYAEYSIVKSGNTHSVQIVGIGYSPGNYPRKPIKMFVTVFPESTAFTVVN